MNSGKSVVDHAEIARAVADIRRGASELTIDDECEAVMIAFEADTSEGMGGGIPPAWEEPAEWLRSNLETMKRKVAEVQKAMYADAQQLEDFSAAVKAREEEVAAIIAQTAANGTATTITSGGTAPTAFVPTGPKGFVDMPSVTTTTTTAPTTATPAPQAPSLLNTQQGGPDDIAPFTSREEFRKYAEYTIEHGAMSPEEYWARGLGGK